jgi:hypothetical protein
MNMATDTDMTMDMDLGGLEMGTDINMSIDNVYSTVCPYLFLCPWSYSWLLVMFIFMYEFGHAYLDGLLTA